MCVADAGGSKEFILSCRENVDHMEGKVYQHARNSFKWRALSTWYQVVTVLSL
jgi:hypothetical protein